MKKALKIFFLVMLAFFFSARAYGMRKQESDLMKMSIEEFMKIEMVNASHADIVKKDPK